MIEPTKITDSKRKAMEKAFKKEYPTCSLDFSKAFNHYYITDKKTNEKSTNISTFELYTKLITK